jgi:hypothetical protein
MTRGLIAIATLALFLTAGSTVQAGCAAGRYHAGCVGPNGAVVAGPRGVHGAATNNVYARPGTSVTGVRGNTATKGVVAGCGWVNGQRVCR